MARKRPALLLLNMLTTTPAVKQARSFTPCQLVWLLMLTDEKLSDENQLILRRLEGV
jgi:hypothetical protein